MLVKYYFLYMDPVLLRFPSIYLGCFNILAVVYNSDAWTWKHKYLFVLFFLVLIILNI